MSRTNYNCLSFMAIKCLHKFTLQAQLFYLTTSVNPSNIPLRYSSVLECGSAAPAF